MTSAPLTPADIKQGLDSHNKYREMHGVPPVEWDDKCYKTAKAWAEHLAKNNLFEHGGHKGMGQNLAMSTGNLNFERATHMWWDEVNEPGYDFTKPTFSSGTGHFTQVVWKGSQKIGMAAAKGKGGTVVVAHYSPPGNYMGHFAENVFPQGGVPPSGVMPTNTPAQKPPREDPLSQEEAATKIQKIQRAKAEREKQAQKITQDTGTGGTATTPTGEAASDEFKAVLDKIPEMCGGWKEVVLQKIASSPTGGTATIEVGESKASLKMKIGCCSSTSSIMWSTFGGGGGA